MKSIQKHNIIRFILFTLVFLIPLTIWNLSVEANDIPVKNTNKTNAEIFIPIHTSNIGKTGIAIASSLGLRSGSSTIAFDTYFQETLSAKDILENREKGEKIFIVNHMIATREYVSILKTNFREKLQTAGNKESALNGIINQLDIRLSVGKKSQENLSVQREIFLQSMKKIDTELEKVKKVINSQFKTGDTTNIQASITKYLDLKEKYTYLRTHLVFADKFIAYYKKLNIYNEKLVTALKLNRDIIIKGSYLVIPNEGNTVLKEYGLLYTENEMKNIIEARKQEQDSGEDIKKDEQ